VLGRARAAIELIGNARTGFGERAQHRVFARLTLRKQPNTANYEKNADNLYEHVLSEEAGLAEHIKES
jgi:hypothetical protein